MSAQVKVECIGDASSLTKAFGQVEKKSSGLGSALGKVGTVAGGILAAGVIDKAAGAIVDGLGTAIDAASDTAEAMNKVDVVFGKSADSVKTFADTSAKSLGISKRAALDATGTFGTLLTNFGLGSDASAEWSTKMVQLAADMGSFNNASPEDTLAAIGAGLRGETEPLRRFGVMLDDAGLKAEAMKLGLYNGKGALDANAKAQAALSLIMAQTGQQQGDFARTQDGLANSTKTNAALMDDMAGKIGEALLPIVTEVMRFAAEKLIPTLMDLAEVVGPIISDALKTVMPFIRWLAAFFMANVLPAVIKLARAIGDVLGPIIRMLAEFFRTTLVPAIKQVATVVGPLLKPLIAKIAAAFRAWAPYIQTVVSILIKVAQVVIPILVRALMIVLPILFRLLGVFFDIIGAIGKVASAIAGLVSSIVNKLLGAISGLVNVGKKIVDAIVKGIKSAGGAILKAILGLLPGPVRDIVAGAIGLKSAPSSAAMSAAGRSAAPGARAPSSGPTYYTINAQGALDPEGTARAIQRVLAAHGRRTGLRSTLSSTGPSI